jgi:hypothetical protein
MKSIGSKSTTGTEAILISCIQYWASKYDLSSPIKAHVLNVGSDRFHHKNEYTLGKTLESTGFPVDKLIENYWLYCKNQPVLKFSIELATKSWKDVNKVSVTKEFINKYITELCGACVKEATRT